MAANFGTLCGNLVGALLRTLLTEEQLYAWGWRLPFLSGILIAFVGVYLKLHGDTSNTEVGQDDRNDTHWEEVFRKENLPALGAATFTPMVSHDILSFCSYFLLQQFYHLIISIQP